MANQLPLISGTGFLISDGVELQYSKGGVAYARLPLVFKRQKKTEAGAWETEKEILVQGTVFGKLAEALTDTVQGRTDLRVTGELYSEDYEGKTYIRMHVHSAWPVKEDRDGGRASASVGSQASAGENFPF